MGGFDAAFNVPAPFSAARTGPVLEVAPRSVPFRDALERFAMSDFTAPRLRRDRGAIRFWSAACLIAFVLAFGLGAVWSDRRASQGGWTVDTAEAPAR